MLKFSAADGMSNKFCHQQVGQLLENKLSYFIHLHKLHSEQWQNLLKAQSITVVQSCFKQTVITDCFQPQNEVLQAYMLYFPLS